MAAEKHAKLTWTGEELDLSVQFSAGYRVLMSGPADSEGATPMEFLLAAAAGCSAMDVISILQKRREPLTGLEIEVSGVQAEDNPHVYTEGLIVYIVKGEGVDPKAVERAIELSQSKYCSASIMLKQAGMNLRTTYRIEPA